MSNKFKATNEQASTIKLTGQRANYRIQAFKDSNGEVPDNVVNFNFAERTQYGRIDQNLNTVYPKQSSLKLLPNNSRALYVIDFVKDQFLSLQKKMKQATMMKHIPSDPLFSDLTPMVAYEDPLNLYLDYMEEYIASHNKSNLSHVKGYQSWVDSFFDLAKRNGKNYPLTFSNFHRTKMSNIFTSGLAISIAELDSGNDPIKENLFLNNKCLDFYLNAAKQYGFSVSKNSPWLLVADLNSPASKVYHNKFDLSSVNEIFFQKYSLCFSRDRDLLKNILEFGYNEFKDINKSKKLLNINKCNKININNIIYNNINNNKYNNSFYNKLYIIARNIEEDFLYSSAELDRIIKNSEIYENKLDKQQAMSYTNEQFRKLVKRRPGGLYSIQQKQQQASEDE